MWLGRKYAVDSGKRLETWRDFRLWATVGKEDYGNFLTCNVREFGSDPTGEGAETQCWCEVRPQYIPNICADEGADCLCNGRVIFGQKYAEHAAHDADDSHEGQRPENAIDATTEPWTVNDANKTGHIACASYNFEDVDPQPHKEKQCYCDELK